MDWKRRGWWTVIASSCLWLSTACSTGQDTTSPPQAQDAGDIDQGGGHLAIAGVEIDVPANAVGKKVTITVTGETAPGGYDADTAYRFGPEGLVFSAPITVTFPAAHTDASIYWTQLGSSDAFEPLATTIANGAATAHPTHFSRGFAGKPKAGPPAQCDGASEEACGNCGSHSRTCTNGAWSDWGACGGQGACTPNTTETCVGSTTQSCGSTCGSQSRTCTNGTWSDWSACSAGGVCRFGDVQSCGTNGTQGCDVTCQWSACAQGITCTNVQTQWNASSQTCVTQAPTVIGVPTVEVATLEMAQPPGGSTDPEGWIQTNGAGITYTLHGVSPFLNATDNTHTRYTTENLIANADGLLTRDRTTGIVTLSYDLSRPLSDSPNLDQPNDCQSSVETKCSGSTILTGCAGSSFQGCGNCGTETRSCEFGGWDNLWGACTGEGVCAPGATEACGVGGTQTCDAATCQWDVCPGQVCTGPTTQSCNAGCGTQARTCQPGGVWSDWASCSATCGGTVTDIAMDGETSCFLQGGQRYCAGSNQFAAFGAGTTDSASHLRPELTATGLTFTALANGLNANYCGLLADGTAYCWARNLGLQLTSGRNTVVTTPVEMAPGTKFTQFDASEYLSCGLTTGKDIVCFGDAGITQATTPPPPSTFAGPWSALAVGVSSGLCTLGGNLVCALDSGGAAFCWESPNCDGEMGNPSLSQNQFYATPQAVAGSHIFKTISVGDGGACAVDTSGVPYCWGYSYDPPPAGSNTPKFVPATSPVAFGVAGETFVDVQGSYDTACGVTSSGKVFCWGGMGINNDGFLCQGTTDNDSHRTPTQIPGLPTIQKIRLGCAISTSGERWCWGPNANGNLGDGTTTNILTPKRIP